MKSVLFCCLFAAAVAGCRSGEPSPGAQAKAAPSAADGVKRFGEPVSGGDAVALSTILSKADEYQGRSVVVEGTVRRNCTVKGCWMELAGGMKKALPGCRVTFKDYGFFVPLDSAGSKARVEGKVEVKTVSASEVEHMEGEGATFSTKMPDGTAREVRIVATGVELRRPG